MKKILLFIVLFVCCLANAQDNKQSIEGLNLYPNPTNTGKIYITSKSGDSKDISIFDVLGKLVLQAVLTTKELNISSLSSGIYIIKIRENETTSARKLIVR